MCYIFYNMPLNAHKYSPRLKYGKIHQYYLKRYVKKIIINCLFIQPDQALVNFSTVNFNGPILVEMT
jgi:hypothetical protein